MQLEALIFPTQNTCNMNVKLQKGELNYELHHLIKHFEKYAWFKETMKN